MGGRRGSGRLTAALLAGGAALAIAQGAPGLTALAPVRRLFPGLAGAGRPDHVALTFDDGPDPRFTPQLLATLDARRVARDLLPARPHGAGRPRARRRDRVGRARDRRARLGASLRHGARAWGAARRSGPGLRHDRGGDRRRAPAVPAAVRGAQRRGADRRASSRVAADPVEFLGTGVGSGGHAGISAGHAWPAPWTAGRRCCCTIPRPWPRPARPRRRWARCPGCWTSAPAAGCGRARSPASGG